MRKKGKLIISCCILFGIMLFIGLAYWILIFIPRERMKGCYFGYEQMPIMSNEKYTGKIDAKMEHILIEDHAGTKVTELDLLGNSPDQVVLGEKTFFLLYRWDDLNNVKNITRRAIKVSSYVMWPLMIGLAVIARPLVIVMLTEKWLPCVPFVWIACFTFGLYPIHSSNQEAIKALGRSDLFLRLEIIKKTIGVTILIISMRYGVMAIALSQIVTSILSTFINASPNRKLLGYSYIEQIKDMIPSFALAVAMGIVIYPLAFIIKNNILLIIAQVIAGIFIYIGLTKVFKNDNLSYLLKFVKRKRQ